MDLIKKLVSNNSFLPLSEPSSIRLPTGLEEIQKALLRLPLVHSLAQSTLLQQASFSTECSLFLNNHPPSTIFIENAKPGTQREHPFWQRFYGTTSYHTL